MGRKLAWEGTGGDGEGGWWVAKGERGRRIMGPRVKPGDDGVL